MAEDSAAAIYQNGLSCDFSSFVCTPVDTERYENDDKRQGQDFAFLGFLHQP